MTRAGGALAMRTLAADQDDATLAALTRLLADAYPLMRLTTDELLAQRTAGLRQNANDPGTAWVLAERDGALVGAMRLYDFTMNVHGRDSLAGGVGAVAVSRAHKRQGIARAMIAWYLDAYRRRGAPFAILHPFRLDFYRALGFGYGTPVHRYRFAPATLRGGPARGTVRHLEPGDLDALLACDERLRPRTHGLVVRDRGMTARLLADAALRYVAVEDGGAVRGFMQTSIVNAPDDRLRNRDELQVRDLLCEDPSYRAALIGYLHAQRDQFARIIVESQDAVFYLASSDPRDGSDLAVAPPAAHGVAETGLGMMYRILDVEAALAHLPPSAENVTVALAVDDPFQPATHGTWTVRFGPGGAPRLAAVAEPDARLAIGIADLSSVVMGSLRLNEVVRHGLASVEPPARLAQVDAVFRAADPPQCMTRF